MWEILIFFSQLLSVAALVMNSKLLRDDRWIIAMINSWLISATQFTFVWVAAHSTNPMLTFFAAAAGGSLGCGLSHHIYTRFIMKPK